MLQTPWTRLSAALIERWQREQMVGFDPEVAELREELADWIAGHAGAQDLGARLGEWLIDHDLVADVFADDAALERTVHEEVQRLASAAAGERAPEPPDRSE